MSDAARPGPVLRLPVRGVWRLVRSPGHAPHAYDLAAVEGQPRRTLAGSRLRHAYPGLAASDSFSWGRDVRSPCDARVVRTAADLPDRHRLHLLRDVAAMAISGLSGRARHERSAGNHVILESDGHFVLLAHLRRGSVRVRAGERVDAGAVVGEVGNSGLSLEPHLHLQLLDSIAEPVTAGAPPFRIHQYERQVDGGWVRVRNEPLRKGDVIRSPATA